MNTVNNKGDKGLVKVMADLVEKGYFAFLPISDTTCVDLIIADQNMVLKRIQVKYRKVTDGKIEIPTSSVVNGKKIPIDKSKIDIWAVYCPDSEKVYYIPSETMKHKKTLILRVSQPKQHQKTINYAKDFLNIEKCWQ